MDNRNENNIDKNYKVILIKNINGNKCSNGNSNVNSIIINKRKRYDYNAIDNKSKNKKHISNQLCQPMRSHNTFSIEQMKFQQYL